MATVVHVGRKFSLELHDVVGRDGVARAHELINHPGAAVVLPILDDGRVVLIANQRFAVGRELLELPAGTLDDGEPPLRAAHRELAEETGYRAARMDLLISFFSTPGICNEIMHVFVARGLTEGATELEPSEQIRNVPMEYAAALDAVRDGRIMDAKTVIALLFFDRWERKA